MDTIIKSAMERLGEAQDVDYRAVSLFRSDMLEKVKRSKFTRILEISWKNGEITSCSLSSRVEYRMTRFDDDYGFTCRFG